MDFPPELERLHQEFQEKSLAFSALIKKASAPDAVSADIDAARAGRDELQLLNQSIVALTDEYLMAAGLTQEQLNSLDAQYEAELNTVIHQDVSIRNYTPNAVKTTARIEEFLPRALEKLLNIVSPEWLRGESRKAYRLDADYTAKPFSLISGMRRESLMSPINRFAQALLVSEDFLENREDYDFHAGALLVPQTAQLGSALEIITEEVQGDVAERVASLSTGKSELVDSTIFELLVAAACIRNGRKIEMLSPGVSKTPDMRVTDAILHMPTVIECKRRRFVTEYERSEEERLRELFQSMAHAFRQQGVYGTVDVEFRVEVTAVPMEEFVSKSLRQALYGVEGIEANYDWGSLRFNPLAKKVELQPTRLYSPSYLESIFNWNGDIPEFDGIVCESLSAGAITTDVASEPIGIKWRSRSVKALKKKQRALGAMLGDAMDQIPVGELGIIYLCYQEGSSGEIADERSRRIQDEFSRWDHQRGIWIPAIFVNRLYARVLGEGNPDLIENAIQMKPQSEHPRIFELFPAQIFTAA